MVRKTLAAVALLTLPLAAAGQNTQTLFSSEVSHGGFGALVYGATSVNGEFAYLRGLRGAWVIKFDENRSLHLGLARYRTETAFDPVEGSSLAGDDIEMSTEYRGFEVEYAHRASRLFHFSGQLLIGNGEVEYRDVNGLDLFSTSDNYFVFQPGVNANMNITDWFRLSGGIFYRYAGGVSLEGTSDRELSGVSIFFALRFGWF